MHKIEGTTRREKIVAAGEMWKSLDAEKRQKYNKKLEKRKRKYAKELEEFKEVRKVFSLTSWHIRRLTRGLGFMSLPKDRGGTWS